MERLLEVIDKKGRKIYLSKERYKHIQKHPHMHDSLEVIKGTIQNPITIRYNEGDEKNTFFYKEFKENESFERYLLVSVKYLNSEGFIVTSFFTNKITGLKWKI